MKEKVILLLFGSACGAILAFGSYLAFPSVYARLALSKGQQFESIDDARKAMLSGSPSDRRSDGSVGLRGIVQPNPSDKIIYELRPNMTEKFEHVMVTTNSFGMRSPQIAVEKPPGTYRVALLGDSYTFGWGVEQDKPFSRVMENELNQAVGTGKKFEVLNFGVPGYATFQEVAQFFEKGQQFKPDAVIVYVISNDFGLPFFIRDLGGNNPASLVSAPTFHSARIDPSDTEKLKRRGELLRALDVSRSLIELGRHCRQEGIPLFIVVHPDSAEEGTKKRIWALHQSKTKKLFSVWSIKEDYQRLVAENLVPPDSLRLPRDHHPGPGAHRLLGIVLSQKLLASLNDPPKLPRPRAQPLRKRKDAAS